MTASPKDLDRDLTLMNDGNRATLARQEIDAQLAERQAQVDERIFRALRKGETLNPQAAVQAWLQKFELAELVRGLERQERRGTAASKRLTPNMR